jgi:NitT/TauT family transport system permease protein
LPQTNLLLSLKSGAQTASWRSARPLAESLLSLLLLLALWEAVSAAVGRSIVPGVIASVEAVIQLSSQRHFWPDILVTCYRIAGAFCFALAFSVLAGAALGAFRPIGRIFGHWVTIAASIPSLLVIIVVYLLAGINNAAAMIGTACVVAPSMTQAVWDGMRAINPELQEMARVFGVPRGRILRKVLLPQTLPFVFSAARNGLSLTWRIMIFVELLGQSSGVGYRIQYFYNVADMTNVIATALPFLVIMLVLELGVLRPLERWVFRWRREETT